MGKPIRIIRIGVRRHEARRWISSHLRGHAVDAFSVL